MATAAVPRVFKNFINGEWVESRSGQAYENRNPANTDELVGMFPVFDRGRCGRRRGRRQRGIQIVAAGARAQARGNSVSRGRNLVQRKEELSKDMTREMGKVLAETRGDVQEAIDMTYYMAGEGRRLFGQTTPSELPNKFAMSARQSIGRVRDDYAVEFSDGDSFVEDDAGAGVRKYRGAQAGGRYAAFVLSIWCRF